MKKIDKIWKQMYGEGGKITRQLAISYIIELLKEMSQQKNEASPSQIHEIATEIDDTLSWPSWITTCGKPTRDEILSLSYRHTCMDPELDEVLTISRMLIMDSSDKRLWQELVDSIDELEDIYSPPSS